MKTMKRFAYVGAIALLSVLGFSACSSSDDATTDGGLTPQTTGEPVKTQFSISLPSQIGGMRMTASTVQDAGTVASFRGMSDIVLIPYLHATDRTNRLGANITLAAGSIIQPASGSSNQANSIPAGSLLANSTAVLYNDVTIPVGTSGFLFYGKATEKDGTNNYDNGALTAAGLTGEASGIFFTPVQIQATPVTTKGDALAAYVTSIAQAKDATDENISWAACANSANSAQTWYSAGLGELYTNFTRMKAGGSAYVQAAVQDLYTSLKNNTDKVSVAIKNAITNSTYVSSVDATTGVLTFKEDAIGGYPGGDNNGMPDGAAALSWSGNTASAVTSVTSSYVQDMTKIVYPASLYYYVDSDVKTSITSQKDAYNGTNTWTQILGKYPETGTSVTSTTRSVAIHKPIQYAVGRLDVTVNQLDQPKYYDMRGDEMTIPTEGYTLTGVLIGGQKAVGYDFTPTGTTEYAIYDNVINTEGTGENAAKNVVKKDQAAGHNYTLALETAAEQDVYVVLEFVNNGDDFMGVDGVVKKGCKFYMVGTLVPDADVTDKVSDVASTGKKVFKQDYTTIAKFTFGAGTADTTGPGGTGGPDGVSDTPGGFANAYTTIPDLRTPELELGFSVDLEWKAGITFNVTF